MRIGLFTDTYFPDINGVATSIQTLKNAFEKMGHDVYIITIKKTFFKTTYDAENKILRIPGIKFKKLYNLTLARPFSISGFMKIRKMKLDIIHIHTELSVAFLGRMVGLLLRKPIVYTYHTEWGSYTHYLKTFAKIPHFLIPRYIKILSNTSTIMTCPSKKTQKILYDHYDIHKKIEVIPTGLDLDKFATLNQQEKEQIKKLQTKYNLKDKKVLLFLGRMGQEKSIVTLIKNFKFLLENNQEENDYVLMLCGFGSELPLYKKYVADFKIEKKVIFTGKIAYEDIKIYYNLAHLFVTASLSETQGLTIIEALACQIPVLISDYENMQETVFEKHNGFYFKNKKQFVKKIKTFFTMSPKQVNIIKTNCFESVRKYSQKQFAINVIKTYKKALVIKNKY